MSEGEDERGRRDPPDESGSDAEASPDVDEFGAADASPDDDTPSGADDRLAPSNDGDDGAPPTDTGRRTPPKDTRQGPPFGGRPMARRQNDEGPRPRDGIRPAFVWLFTTDHGFVTFLREIAVSVLVVLLIGGLLFGVSGVWPPMVAVESGSMEPHLYRGDLVFVMDEHRLAPNQAVGDTGIVTEAVGAETGYERFGDDGDVIVYTPFGSDTSTPVIHRAHFYVEEGENWYDRADPAFVDAGSCDELRFCPAPYDGFITKGDNNATNDYYDQARGISTPVKSEWIRGRAVLRVPWLGWVRLAVSDSKVPGVAAGVDIAEKSVPSV